MRWSWSERLRAGRAEAIAAASILAVAAAVVLLPLASPGPLYYRDLSQNFLPIRLLASSLRADGFSLGWNPYLGGGVPLASNPNWLLRHPAWMLDRWVAPATAIKATICAHGLLAGLCLAGFLRRRGRSAAASAAGAAAFVLAGPFLSLGTLPNLLTAVAWIPPAMLMLDLARGGARWCFPIAVACGAFSLMAADPAAAATLAAGSLLAWFPPHARANGTAGARKAFLFLALSIGVASVAWIPAMQLIGRSERGRGLDIAETGKWSLHPARLPELLSPGWLGDPTSFSAERYWGAGWLETGLPFLLSIYLGASALALAFVGAADGSAQRPGAARKERNAGLALFMVGLTLAFGRHLPGYGWIVTHVPGVSLYRYPEKMLLPLLLGLALLVARGVDCAAESLDTRRARAYAGALLALSAAMLLGAFAGRGGLAAIAKALFFRELGAEAVSNLARGILHATSFTAASGLVLLAASRGRLSASSVRIAAAGLVCADLSLASVAPSRFGSFPLELKVNPMAPSGFLETPPARAAHPEEDREAREGWRTFRGERPDGFVFRRRDDSIAWGFLWDRVTLNRAWPAGFHDRTAFDRPTDKMYPSDATRAAGVAFSASLEERLRLWSLDSVRYVTSYVPLVHPRLVEIDRFEGASRPPLVRYENSAPLPRARIVLHRETARDAASALRRALDPEIDPSHTVVLESAEAPGPPGEPSAANAGGEQLTEGGAEIVVDEPTRIVVRATLESSGWLVLSENFDPDWKATVDGARAPLLRAYGFLRAVALPEGAHEIVMAYEPRSTLAGAGLLAVSIVLSVGSAFLLPKGRRAQD